MSARSSDTVPAGWRATSAAIGRGAPMSRMSTRPRSSRGSTTRRPARSSVRRTCARIRRLDPAAARTWLEGAWDGLRANDKAMVAALEVGLTDADLPFLERVGSEKNRDRRAMVGRVMARLPGSAFVRRLEARGGRSSSARVDSARDSAWSHRPTRLWAELEADGHAVSTVQWSGGPRSNARRPDLGCARLAPPADPARPLVRVARPGPAATHRGADQARPANDGVSGPIPALAVATAMHRDPVFAVALSSRQATLRRAMRTTSGTSSRHADRPPLVFAVLRRKPTGLRTGGGPARGAPRDRRRLDPGAPRGGGGRGGDRHRPARWARSLACPRPHAGRSSSRPRSRSCPASSTAWPPRTPIRVTSSSWPTRAGGSRHSSRSGGDAMTEGLLRDHAEREFADGAGQALAETDDRPRPPSWRLSPQAVVTYLVGGKAGQDRCHRRSTSATGG